MKNRNQTIQGYVYRYNSSSVLLDQTLNAAYSYFTTSGPVTHGNMVDPNSWSYTVRDIGHFRGVRTDYYPTPSTLYSTDRGYFGGSSDQPSYPTWNRTLLYNKALEKFNNLARGGLDLGVSLAEIHSTSRMLRGVTKVTNLARGLNTKGLANGWLQWTYGWKPLLSDVYGVADESIRVVLNRIERFNARSSLPIRIDDSQSRIVRSLPVTVDRNGTGKESCTISCKLVVPDFDLARWTSLNPVSLSWELIPYSFVVDWFYDVGSWLRNLETALLYSARFQSGYRSELYCYQGTEKPRSTRYTFGSQSAILRDTLAQIRVIEFVRTKLTSYPLPLPPTFQVDLGSNRLLSAASLLRQLMKR